MPARGSCWEVRFGNERGGGVFDRTTNIPRIWAHLRGVIIAITKTGTEPFHSRLMSFSRDNALDAAISLICKRSRKPLFDATNSGGSAADDSKTTLHFWRL